MVDFFERFLATVGYALRPVIGGYEAELTSVVLYTVAIAIYVMLVWNFYRFIAKKDIFIFKGEKKEEVPSWVLMMMYIIVFPVMTFFAFLFFSMMLIFLAKEQALGQILLISVTLIASIRIASYYHEDLARDLAKMIPLALLGIFLVDPSYYSVDIVIERLYTLPSMAAVILRYLLFVIILEWLLRILSRLKHYMFGNK